MSAGPGQDQRSLGDSTGDAEQIIQETLVKSASDFTVPIWQRFSANYQVGGASDGLAIGKVVKLPDTNVKEGEKRRANAFSEDPKPFIEVLRDFRSSAKPLLGPEIQLNAASEAAFKRFVQRLEESSSTAEVKVCSEILDSFKPLFGNPKAVKVLEDVISIEQFEEIVLVSTAMRLVLGRDLKQTTERLARQKENLSKLYDENAVAISEKQKALEGAELDESKREAVRLARFDRADIVDSLAKIRNLETLFISTYPMLLQDAGFSTEILSHIFNQSTALGAVTLAFTDKISGLEKAAAEASIPVVRDINLKTANELSGLLERLVEYIRDPEKGEEDKLAQLEPGSIIVARDLTAMGLQNIGPQENIAGVCIDTAHKNTHTVLYLRANAMPAVAGCGEFYDAVDEDAEVVFHSDAGIGRVWVSPSDELKEHFQVKLDEGDEPFERIKSDQIITMDGEVIDLGTNVNTFKDLRRQEQVGLRNKDLVRTEVLLTDLANRRGMLLSDVLSGGNAVELQVKAYKRVVEAADGGRVRFRTLDAAPDKPINNDSNRLPGLQGCLQEEYREEFLTQIEAILRVSAIPGSDVQIMFPGVNNLDELKEGKDCVLDVMKKLKEEGVPFNENIPLGIMLETNPAVIQLERLMPEVNFLSIGTNDLEHAVLGTKRFSSGLYQAIEHRQFGPHNPSFLTILSRIKRKVENFNAGQDEAGQLDLCVCGMIASEPEFAEYFVGLGFRHLSIRAAGASTHSDKLTTLIADDNKAFYRAILTSGLSSKQVYRLIHGYARLSSPEEKSRYHLEFLPKE